MFFNLGYSGIDKIMKKISIILPVYNEEGCIQLLVAELSEVINRLDFVFELIFINDGSTDGTYEKILEERKSDKRIKLIDFSRNFGHQTALSAGLDFATGEAVIMMDADLQHPPDLLPEMIDKWLEGYDVVYTIRKDTQSKKFF